MHHPLGRIFTILPLFVLIILSFLGFPAQASAFGSSDHLAARHSRQIAAKRSIAVRQGPPPGLPGGGGGGGGGRDDDDEPPNDTSSVTDSITSTSTESTTDTTTSTSQSLSDTTSSLTTTSLTTTSTSESTFSTESTSSSESESTSTFTSELPPTTSEIISTSSETLLSTTSLPTSRSTPVTTIPGSTATAVVVAGSPRLTSSTSTSSSVETIAAATSTESASASGFLSNRGAMAGTFTALGIVVIGAVCAAVLLVRKKKRSEDLDIFDTEYRQSGNALGGSSSGNDDYFASDMTSLSANAVSHAGEYSHVDYGFGLPATAADRTSVASNHAGYGAFRSAAEQRKPPMQSSGLRQELSWDTDATYAEPAVDENQSMHIVPSHNGQNGQYYASATRVPGTSY